MDFLFDLWRTERATEGKKTKPKPKSSSMTRSSSTSRSAPAPPTTSTSITTVPNFPPRKPMGEKLRENVRAAGDALRQAKQKAADGSKRACAPIAAGAKSAFRVGRRKIGGDDPNSKARRAWSWALARPLRVWRVAHALACLAAGTSRVNAPSAVYLFLFTAQCSLAPAGGLYQGTARKESLDRTHRLHAWFSQRRLLWLTVTASGACLAAQIALHVALRATGDVVRAETGVWRAMGIHRFDTGADAAAAVVPDVLLLLTSSVALTVVRSVCALAMTNRFKHAVKQVMTLQRGLRRRGKPWKVHAGFDGTVGLTEAALAAIQSAKDAGESSTTMAPNEGNDSPASRDANHDSPSTRVDERLEAYVEVIPPTRTSSRAAALWRVLGSAATAAAGSWRPSILNAAVFLVAVAHFTSHAADRRVPRLLDSIGAVRSMRGWAATAALVPYVASVVEVAFGGVGGAARDFGLTGGGELRRQGSDWNWLCHSVGLWPMANSRGRWCSCMDEDRGFAWAWAIIALALFGMGGDGPGRPGEGSDGSENGKTKKGTSRKLWRYLSWTACVEAVLRRPGKKRKKEDASPSEGEGEELSPASPSESGPGDGGESRSSAKLAPEKRPAGQHDVRVDLLQKLRLRQEMGGSSSAADLQRLLREAETRGSASGVWVSRGEADIKPRDDESDVRIIVRSINYLFVTTFTKASSLARTKSLKKSSTNGGGATGPAYRPEELLAAVGGGGGSKKRDPMKGTRSIGQSTKRVKTAVLNTANAFWSRSGESIGAAAGTLNRRADGPFGGGILPLFASFMLATSYPSLLSVPLLLWSMLPFIAPWSLAADGDRGDPLRVKKASAIGEGPESGKEEAEASPPAMPESDPSKPGPPQPSLSRRILNRMTSGSFKRMKERWLQVATWAGKSKLGSWASRERRSAKEFVALHVAGRYRWFHFIAAMYATGLLILDYGSRLSTEMIYVNEASSDNSWGSALMFGPARRASAAATLLFKLLFVAMMLRPHPRRDESKTLKEAVAASTAAKAKAELAAEEVDELEDRATEADDIDRAHVDSLAKVSDEIAVTVKTAEANKTRESFAPLEFVPDEEYVRELQAWYEENSAARQQRALRVAFGDLSPGSHGTGEGPGAFERKLEGAMSEAELAEQEKREDAEDRKTLLRLRRQCRHRRRFAARRDAWVKRLDHMSARTRAMIAADPGKTPMGPLWWVQYVAMLSFVIAVANASTIIAGGMLCLLLLYVASVDWRYSRWWWGCAYVGLTMTLQVTWLSIAEAYLITEGTVDSRLAEGLGLKIYGVRAPLWASGEFFLMLLLLVVVVAELVVNDARKLHDRHVERYGADAEATLVAGTDEDGKQVTRKVEVKKRAATSEFWLDDLGATVGSIVRINPRTSRQLRGFGRWLQEIEPLGVLPLTLLFLVLCGLTPSEGHTADFVHMFDVMTALGLLLSSLLSFRNLTHRIHRLMRRDEERFEREKQEEHERLEEERRMREEAEAEARERSVRGADTPAEEGLPELPETPPPTVPAPQSTSRLAEARGVPAPRIKTDGSEGSSDEEFTQIELATPKTEKTARRTPASPTPKKEVKPEEAKPSAVKSDQPTPSPKSPAVVVGSKFRFGNLNAGAMLLSSRGDSRRDRARAASHSQSSIEYVRDMKPWAETRRRVRRGLRIYVAFQCMYITALYMFNVQYVNRTVHKYWPDEIDRIIVPDDFGMFVVTSYAGNLWPRILTLLFAIFNMRWLDWKHRRDRHPPAPYEDSDDEKEIVEKEKKVGYDRKGWDPSVYLAAVATFYVTSKDHVKKMFGPKFEALLQKRAMDILLLTVIACVAASIDLFGVFHSALAIHAVIAIATVKSFEMSGLSRIMKGGGRKRRDSVDSLIEEEAGADQKKKDKPKTWGERFAATYAALPALPALPWRKKKGEIEKATSHEEVELLESGGSAVSQPLGDFGEQPASRRGRKRSSLYHEANDYGLMFAGIASVSMILKYVAQLRMSQLGGIFEDVTGPSWGTWLGLIRLTDPRLESIGDVRDGAETCCQWPNKLSSSGSYCVAWVDPYAVTNSSIVAVSAAGDVVEQAAAATRTCSAFAGYWWQMRYQFAIIVIASMQCLLQSRHNLLAAKKATAAIAAAHGKKIEVTDEDESSKKSSPEKKEEKNDGVKPSTAAAGAVGASAAAVATAESEKKGPAAAGKKTMIQESQVQLRRMVEYVFVSIATFNFAEFLEKLEYLSEAAPFFNYIIAMALLLSSAFLKSNISSIFYIAILGYLQSENSEEGLRRVHKEGHYVVIAVGVMVMVHVLASLRLPDILLDSDYCVDCPTRRFWLNFGSCPDDNPANVSTAILPMYTLPPPPPAPSPPPPGQIAVIDSDAAAGAISEQEAAANQELDQLFYDSRCKRPVTTTEYSIIPDLIVMLLLAYFIRRAKLVAMSESARMTWKRGMAGVMKSNREIKKGAEAGKARALTGSAKDEEAFEMMREQGVLYKRQKARASDVSEEIAKKDATLRNRRSAKLKGESGRDGKFKFGVRDDPLDPAKGGDSSSSDVPTSSLSDAFRTAKVRSDARVRRAKATPVAEAGGVDLKSMTPEQRKVHRERMLAGEKLKKTLRNAGEALGHALLVLVAICFLPLIILFTVLAGVNRKIADLIGIGYVIIAVVFAVRLRDLRLNLCIRTGVPPSRTNIELFRILPLYVYAILACKLLYQVPYFLPHLFEGGIASKGKCDLGTAGCDTWMDFVGALKLDKACDPSMMEQCSGVLSWSRGGILPEILLFVMCAIQQNLNRNERYVEIVWSRQLRSARRSEKATVLHVQRMIDWRNSEVEDRRRHYRETIYSIQDSAAQVKAWTEELRKAEETPVVVMDPDSGDGAKVSEVPLKPYVTVINPTTVKITCEMLPNAPPIEYFTVKREPHPRLTALSHYSNPIEVAVEKRPGRERRGGHSRAGAQKGVVEIKDLKPGKGYTFVVHSYTESNGHSTESEASDPIELPMETEEQTDARKKKEEEEKEGSWAMFKRLFKKGVDVCLDKLAYLLDPAVYPIPEVNERYKEQSGDEMQTIMIKDVDDGLSDSDNDSLPDITKEPGAGSPEMRRRRDTNEFEAEMDAISNWFHKGHWGNKGGVMGFFGGIIRLVYSLSEWFAYASICGALLTHTDFFSVLPVIWVMLVALVRNPHPAPESWWMAFWYSIAVLIFRVTFQTKAFCMDVDEDTSPSDLNHFTFSMQPQCPATKASLFNWDNGDWMYATNAVVFLTVKTGASTILNAVLVDIFVCASLLLHIDHLNFVGIRTYEDMKYIRPCINYSRLHGLRTVTRMDEIKDGMLGLTFEEGVASDSSTPSVLSPGKGVGKPGSGSGSQTPSALKATPASIKSKSFVKRLKDLLGERKDEDLYGIPEFTGRKIMWPGQYYREACVNQLEGDRKRDEKPPSRKEFREKYGTAIKEKKINKNAAVKSALKTFGRDLWDSIKYSVKYAVGTIRDFLTEIQLSNKTEPPSRNTGKPGRDLYPIEFFLQILSLVWLIFDFSNLNFENSGQASGAEQLQSGLTIAILTSTLSMVISRLVYVSQNMLMKYVMQVAYTLTLLLHIFIILPLVDGRAFVKAHGNVHLKAFVACQLLYLLVSALQIRTGYREGSQYQTLFMKLGTGPVAYYAFMIYQSVPFLFELRTLLDWVMSESSLDLLMWFRFENLYHMLWKDLLYQEARRQNKEIYSGRDKFPLVFKMLQGFTIFTGIILLLLAPIFLFSSINPVLSPNKVTSANLNVELRVRVNSSLAVYNIYQAQAQSVEMSGEDIDASERYLMTSPLTQKFDAECLLFPRHSSVSWVLPAGPRGALATNLVTHAKWLNTTRQLTSTSTSESQVELVFTTAFTRVGPPTAKTVQMEVISPLTSSQALEMGTMINDISDQKAEVAVERALPRLLNLPPRDQVIKLSKTAPDPNPSDDATTILSLERLDDSLMIWGLRTKQITLAGVKEGFCGMVDYTEEGSQGVLYATMSDRFLSGVVEQLGLDSYSMLALYAFIFVAIGGVVRRFFQFKIEDVMIYEIPNPDYLLRLCRGLRMLRAHRYPGCRRDEIKLFHTLIQMLRSPDILIRVTRNKDV